MFICMVCLGRDYEWPKFEDWFRRSAGPCEICGKVDVTADVQTATLVIKGVRTSWECANKADEDCRCGPITPEHEVIEIQYDVLGGVRAIVRENPNQKRADPIYVRSFTCAGKVVKAHLRSKAKQVDLEDRLPKMATWGTRV
jgi:hypothetical protein